MILLFYKVAKWMQSSFETCQAQPHLRAVTVVHRFPNGACRARGRGRHMPCQCCCTRALHGTNLSSHASLWSVVKPSLPLHTGSIYSSLHCFSGQDFLFHSPNLKGRARITHLLFSSVRSCRCIWAQLLINSDVMCWEKCCLSIAFAWHLEE